MPLSSCGISFLVWNVCFNCLTTTIVALRLWANYADRKGVRLPDYMMLVAYVSCTHFGYYPLNWPLPTLL